MSSKNLLVELFVEELPPKSLKKLGNSFAEVLAASLKSQRLAGSDVVVTSYASPRRLAVHVANVLQEELSQQLTGDVPSQIDSTYLNTLHMTDRLPHWREVAGAVQRAAGKELAHG